MLDTRLEYNIMYIDIYKYSNTNSLWEIKNSFQQVFSGLETKISRDNLSFANQCNPIYFSDKFIFSVGLFPSLDNLNKSLKYKDVLSEANHNYNSKDYMVYINMFENNMLK